jgi:hypothetical protein
LELIIETNSQKPPKATMDGLGCATPNLFQQIEQKKPNQEATESSLQGPKKNDLLHALE